MFLGPNRRRPTYEQRNECAWLLGFLRQRQIEKIEIMKENMLEYLVELLQDALDHS